MTEQPEQQAPQGETPISMAELSRFLSAHQVPSTCPHCGVNNWGHFNSDALEGVSMSRLGGDGLVYPDTILPALVLSCNNCAYIWMIARKQVARWLAENLETSP